MNPQKFLYIQILLEGLLPVLGYLYWDWDASFILLFFFIDWILFWSLSYLKARKSSQHQSNTKQEKQKNTKQLIIGLSGIIITSTLVFFLMYQIHPEFSWKERIWAFLSYSDMGIPQGVVLIPLLVLNGVLDYKQKFIAPQLYTKIPSVRFSTEISKQGIITSVLFALLLIVSIYVQIPDAVLLFGTIGGVISYRLLNRKPLGF